MVDMELLGNVNTKRILCYLLVLHVYHPNDVYKNLLVHLWVSKIIDLVSSDCFSLLGQCLTYTF